MSEPDTPTPLAGWLLMLGLAIRLQIALLGVLVVLLVTGLVSHFTLVYAVLFGVADWILLVTVLDVRDHRLPNGQRYRQAWLWFAVVWLSFATVGALSYALTGLTMTWSYVSVLISSLCFTFVAWVQLQVQIDQPKKQ